ncbi:MAG: tyrosine-type recombinase/integrase [Hyphomicrobiaceae bacterium]|nr:tyrosine-type recombinase/integrase [Hyphomicrobiaceae bacterium]
MPKRSEKYIRTVQQVRHSAKGEHRIEGGAGLLLVVNEAGNRSWVFRYRSPLNRRPRRMGLGAFPGVGLAGALEAAARVQSIVEAGRDPLTEKGQRGRALNVADLCDAWLTLYAVRERRTIAEPQRLIAKHIKPALGTFRADALTRRDVLRLIDDMTVATPIQANRTLTVLRSIYNWAMSRDMVPTNPTLGIKKSSEAPRERTLSEGELRALWRGLNECVTVSPVARNVYRLQLLTACRIGEALGAKQSEFDVERRIWTIPAVRTKSGKTHELPLSPLACDVYRDAKADANASEWLFPAERTDGPVRRDTLKDEPIALRNATGISDWRSHDLRRTAATWMGENGVAGDVIERVLNHSKQGVTDRHYNHAQLREPMREALERWANYLQGIHLRERAS